MSTARITWALVLALLLCMLAAAPAHAASKAQRNAAVHRAYSLIGTPYGHGPGQIVCTDLTRLSWYAGNRSLPYTLYGQKRAAHKPRGKWKPGDLVFYDSYLNGLLDHVALYVGNGMVIDANKYWGTTLKHPVDSIPGYRLHKRIN